MSLPIRCSACSSVNFIDLEHLQKSPLNKLSWEYGFSCSKCGKWTGFFVSNPLIDEALLKLARRKADKKFRFHLGKTLRRIVSLREQAGI